MQYITYQSTTPYIVIIFLTQKKLFLHLFLLFHFYNSCYLCILSCHVTFGDFFLSLIKLRFDEEEKLRDTCKDLPSPCYL